MQRRVQVPTCPQCSQHIILGQYICQHCNKGLRKRISHDTARRNLASARHQYVGNIATLTGKAVADLTEGDLRGAHGHDVMKRGIISLDANAIAQARKAIKRAASDGHDSVYTRFTRDRTYALRMVRSHSQRRLAQGSSNHDPTGTSSSNDLRPARFVFFDEEMRNFQRDNEIRSTSALGDRLYCAGLLIFPWPLLGLARSSRSPNSPGWPLDRR